MKKKTFFTSLGWTQSAGRLKFLQDLIRPAAVCCRSGLDSRLFALRSYRKAKKLANSQMLMEDQHELN